MHIPQLLLSKGEDSLSILKFYSKKISKARMMKDNVKTTAIAADLAYQT